MTLIKYRDDLRDFVPTSFSSLLDNFFNENLKNVPAVEKFLPKVDIAETEKTFEINLAVPGMKKEDFNIELTEGVLTVSGDRKFVNEDKGKNYHTIQTQYGSFSKTFQLPDNINRDKIDANYEDGILKLNIAKDEKKTLKSFIKVK